MLQVKDPARSERIRKDVQYRIEEQIAYFGGKLPDRHTLAWAGYLAALLEEGLLDFVHYKELRHLLPPIEDPNPVSDIFIFEPDNPLLKA